MSQLLLRPTPEETSRRPSLLSQARRWWLLGAVLAALLLFKALLPDAGEQDYTARLVGPSLHHPFGTDQLGRDIAARVIQALFADVPLVVGITGLTLVLGTAIGLLSRLHPSLEVLTDMLTDTVLAFPHLLLVLIVLTGLGLGLMPLVIAATLIGLPLFVRLTKTLTQKQFSEVYVEAATALGASPLRLLTRHILPNIAPVLLGQTLLQAAETLLLLASLSYLGLGRPPPTPSLGSMLQDARLYFMEQIWAAVAPGIVVFALALALSALGRSLNRHTSTVKHNWLTGGKEK